MGNMSYCRFENTATDLRDCEDALEEMIDAPQDCGTVNEYEMSAAPRLFDSAANILEMLASVVGADIVITNSDGVESSLAAFDWADAFGKVQQNIKDAQEESDGE